MDEEETEQEMVSIEVPLEQVVYVFKHGQPKNQDNEIWIAACGKVLDARKSKFERWLKEISQPDSRVWYPGPSMRWISNPCQAKLLAAAPKMIEKLIMAHKLLSEHRMFRYEVDELQKVIELALPKDVAEGGTG